MTDKSEISYYQKNREAQCAYTANYLKTHNVKTKCNICNCEVLRFNMGLHERTQKHMINVERAHEISTLLAKSELRQMLLKMKATIVKQREQLAQNSPPKYNECV